MRIVAGKHRGRVLSSPEDNAIRPTSDKVRLAVFNMLNSRSAVMDAIVLDAFCGTGALALEALSQGAAQAVLIDQEKKSLDLAKRNAATLREEKNCSFLLKDATKIGPRPSSQEAATLCFLDPPYRKEILPNVISYLKENNWLAKDCWIVAEMEAEYSLAGFSADAEKIYGETKILIGRL
ncbi:MAG: 16S rRNA (guanine(966)-N(2))-methyltransferase RsmD [Micavibrio aeruginosavorus]|uniref:16S rRNA (Guanine(966)-N(2))-methyltransferase RsmD n=1 Tax=Micavibrio aeruginosavorus TaxID=349221 RepID=A0A2W5FLI0_9BACT|nr:MAG: 16S rRNA (guanine(966)-N(2))-methyltransferase RsmD [Micavibrio aeruginosavorus]